jgi:hypothetical protein
MAKAKKNTTEAELRQQTQETAVIIEDALRSIADNIGDLFKEALEAGEDISKAFVKDFNKELQGLYKLSSTINNLQEKAVKGKLSERDISKVLLDRQNKINTLKIQQQIAERKGLSIAEDLKKELEEIISFNEGIEESLKEQLEYSNKIKKALGLTGTAMSGLEKITKELGLSGLDDVFARGREEAEKMATQLMNAGKNMGSFSTKLKVAFAGMKGMARGIGQFFKPEAILAGITGIISKMVSFIKEAYEEGKNAAARISEENVGMARSIGLAQSEATKLAENFKGIGPTVAASKQSVEGIYTALGTTEKLSNNTLKTFIKLNTYAGMSAENLAEIQRLSKVSGQDAGVLASNMANTALQMKKNYNLSISVKNLLAETSKVSNILKVNLGGSGTALVKAVAQSKSLGLEFDKIEGISNSLLNIEDSISAQMEAELLTGKSLNLEKAREYALNHNIEGLSSEIAKNFGSINEFQNLNTIQQEAYAKAIGMTKEDLAGVLIAQKENRNIQGDLVKGQKDGIASMSSEMSLAEKQANIDRQREEASIKFYETLVPLVQEWQKLMGAIKEVFASIFKEIAGPGMQNLSGSISHITKNIKSFTYSIVNTFKTIYKYRALITALLGAAAIGMSFVPGGAVLAMPLGTAALAMGSITAIGDDVVSSGYGDRKLVTSSGTYALNNQDTVIAGTNLFRANDIMSKADDVMSYPKGALSVGGGSSDNSGVIAAIKELIGEVRREKPIIMDGNKVGVAQGLSKYQSR